MPDPLSYSDAAHQAAHQFLVEEARALDEHDFERWLSMLSEDVRYRVPVRITTARGTGFDEHEHMSHYDEDLHSLRKRVERLTTEHAWAEDPRSRTRHFVTNVLTFARGQGELEVLSNLLLFRSRGDVHPPDLISAARTDVLREDQGVWRLARRAVKLDDPVLRTQNLSIFL